MYAGKQFWKTGKDNVRFARILPTEIIEEAQEKVRESKFLEKGL